MGATLLASGRFTEVEMCRTIFNLGLNHDPNPITVEGNETYA